MEFYWRPWRFKLEEAAFPGGQVVWYGKNDRDDAGDGEIYGGEAVESEYNREYPGAPLYDMGEGDLQQLMVRHLGQVNYIVGLVVGKWQESKFGAYLPVGTSSKLLSELFVTFLGDTLKRLLDGEFRSGLRSTEAAMTRDSTKYEVRT